MKVQYSQNWWMIALKGLFIFILGAIILMFPLESVEAALIYLAILMGLGGVVIINFSRKVNSPLKKWLFIEGVFDIALSILIIFYPQKSAIVLAILLGLWLIINGIFQFHSSLRFREQEMGWKLTMLSGMLAFIVGIMVCFHPIAGIFTFSYLFGIPVEFFGLSLIIQAFKRRNKNAK